MPLPKLTHAIGHQLDHEAQLNWQHQQTPKPQLVLVRVVVGLILAGLGHEDLRGRFVSYYLRHRPECGYLFDYQVVAYCLTLLQQC